MLEFKLIILVKGVSDDHSPEEICLKASLKPPDRCLFHTELPTTIMSIDPSHKSHSALEIHSHNAPICNRNVHICTHFCYKVLHCEIWDRRIVGFVQQIYSSAEKLQHANIFSCFVLQIQHTGGLRDTIYMMWYATPPPPPPLGILQLDWLDSFRPVLRCLMKSVLYCDAIVPTRCWNGNHGNHFRIMDTSVRRRFRSGGITAKIISDAQLECLFTECYTIRSSNNITMESHQCHGAPSHRQFDSLFGNFISALLTFYEVSQSVNGWFPSQRASNVESVPMS